MRSISSSTRPNTWCRNEHADEQPPPLPSPQPRLARRGSFGASTCACRRRQPVRVRPATQGARLRLQRRQRQLQQHRAVHNPAYADYRTARCRPTAASPTRPRCRRTLTLPRRAVACLAVSSDGASYGTHPALAGLRGLFNSGRSRSSPTSALGFLTTQAAYQNGSVAVPPQLSRTPTRPSTATSRPDDANANGWAGASPTACTRPTRVRSRCISLSNNNCSARHSSTPIDVARRRRDDELSRRGPELGDRRTGLERAGIAMNA